MHIASFHFVANDAIYEEYITYNKLFIYLRIYVCEEDIVKLL